MNAPQSPVRFPFSPRHAMKFGTPVPDMGTGPIPAESVTSAEYFEREREQIFKQAWLEVGRVEEIPNPGDYFTREMHVFKSNIVVVRGKDGVIRAFHNMCTHRGMALATEACGNARGFTCEFHGWGFGLDGSLQAVPAIEEFPGLDKGKLGLKALACDTWNGFIFVHWSPKPEQSLAEFMGQLAKDMDGFPFDQCQHIAHYTARVNANWKLCIDAFQEAYHATYLHRHAIPGAGDIELALPTSVRFYGPHRSVSCWLKTDIQPTPAEAIAYKYGHFGFVKADEGESRGLNPSGDDSWWFDINVFFPNFFIDVGPGWYFTYNFWPVAVDESTWEMNIYQLDAKTAGQKFAQEHTKVLLRDILYEDLSTLEFAQKAMASGVLKHLPISEMEIAVRHQLHTVQEWVNRP